MSVYDNSISYVAIKENNRVYIVYELIPFISQNTGKFLLRDLAELTNRVYCTSQREALINRFPTIFCSVLEILKILLQLLLT